MKRAAISGFGCICSLGNDIKQISKNLYEQDINPSLPTERFESSFSGQYPVFQVNKELLSQKKEDESFSYLFLRKALDEALQKADLKIQDLRKTRIGVCIGTSVDASFNCFDFYKSWRLGKNKDLKPLYKTLSYSISRQVLIDLNLKGFFQTITTACASSTDALGICSQWIENDICDIAIAGGADELNLIPYTGFIKLMIASKEPCKPFDKNRKGINLGEGAGVFILESQESIEKRKSKKLGIVLGYGSACDGYHATSPHPQARGLIRAFDFALKQTFQTSDLNEALIKANEKIAFINAHATASIDNDMIEGKALKNLFPNIAVTATKSLTGHCLGAAGAVEACITLICLNENKIPKTKNFDCMDENINLIPVLSNTSIDGSKAAISNSLSFGGCNSVLILGGQNYE